MCQKYGNNASSLTQHRAYFCLVDLCGEELWQLVAGLWASLFPICNFILPLKIMYH